MSADKDYWTELKQLLTQTDRYNDTVALFQGVLAVKRLF